MELNTKAVNVLKNLSSEEGFLTDEEFSRFAKSVFDSFEVNLNSGSFDVDIEDESRQNLEKLWSAKKRSQAELKETIAALYMLITELARNNSDKTSAGAFLEELGFNSNRIKIFSDNYDRKIKTIRLFLSCISDSLPHIVDISWRLDYCIKESNQERINEPIFIVELKVEKPFQDGLSTIKFLCNIEQLQDLVYKLKEATKSIEKLVQ